MYHLRSLGCLLEADGMWTVKVVFTESQRRGKDISHDYGVRVGTYEDAMRFVNTIGLNMEESDAAKIQP